MGGNLLDILHSRHTGFDSVGFGLGLGSDSDLDSGIDIVASVTCPVDDSSTQY